MFKVNCHSWGIKPNIISHVNCISSVCQRNFSNSVKLLNAYTLWIKMRFITHSFGGPSHVVWWSRFSSSGANIPTVKKLPCIAQPALVNIKKYRQAMKLSVWRYYHDIKDTYSTEEEKSETSSEESKRQQHKVFYILDKIKRQSAFQIYTSVNFSINEPLML